MARLLLFGGKGGVGKTTTSSATAVWLADAGLKVLLVSSDPAHSTSDSLDVKLGPVPVEVEGVPGLYGLEMDPEAKLSNLLPKVGEAMNNMGGGSCIMIVGRSAWIHGVVGGKLGNTTRCCYKISLMTIE